MILAAPRGFSLSDQPTQTLIYIGIGIVILLVFVVASRVVARFAGDQLLQRNVRTELIVISRRVVTVIVIALGIFLAFGFALSNSNIPLLGILVATVVAALGVQDLLKDYVSGYYVLLERHIRVGDRISLDLLTGTVTEIRLRVTLLKSDAGDLIVVPNAELFTKSVMIHTLQPDDAKSEPPA